MIMGMVIALSVQAQGQFVLAEGDQFQAGAQVTTVPQITLTFGKEGSADFKAAKADTKVDGYTAYTEGNGTNGENEDGTFYVFAPEKTGLVSAAFALKGDAKLFVEEDGKVLTNFNGISCKTDYANVFDICVKAGKTYKVYSSESELGFYGFEYKVAQNLTTIANDFIKANSSSAEYQIELEPGGVYYMSGPIVSDKGIVILGNAKNNPIVDASDVTSSIIKMNTTPAVPYVDGKRYEIDKVVLKNINFKGVYQYIYDDMSIVYGVNNFIIEGCQFELTNTKADIDCPFRFRAGGPVKFSMKDNTMYQTGKYTYKYVVKTDNNWPDKRFATFTGPYVWEIENNTILGVANTGQFMNGGRTANVYKKTSLSIKNNIFIDCVKANTSNFWQKVFGGKTSDSNRKEFVYLSTTSNTYITNGEDVSSCTVNYDKGTKLTSEPLFAFPAKGDFTLAEDCEQYTSLTGDPRWLKNFVGDIYEVSPESGADLAATIDAAFADNGKPGAIILQLAKDAKYTVSGALFVNCPLYINGAEGVEIDAAASNAPFILMRPLPELGLNDQGAFKISEISIKDVKITGLKNRLFYANRQNYLIGKLAVENSIIQVDGTTPRSIFDFYCGGNYEELSIVNSTLYAEPSNAMRSGLTSTQASLSVIELGGESQKLSIKNSTLYNIAKGMTPVLQQRHSQYYLSFELMDNVIVNCGEKGNFVAGLNEGHKSSEVEWVVDSNAFNFDGEDSGANEAYGNALSGVVKFADAAKGDFTQSNVAAGDPRWISGTPTAIETVKTAEETSQENAVIYNLNGQRIDKAQAKSGVFIVNGKKVVIK